MKKFSENCRCIAYDFVFTTQDFPLTIQLLDGRGSPGWHHHENFYEIVLVVEGNSQHLCEKHSFNLLPRELLIIAPCMRHNYSDKKFCYYNILVDLSSSQLPLLDIANTEGFQKLFVLTPRSYFYSSSSVLRNFLELDDFLHAIILLKSMYALQKNHNPGWQLAMLGKFIEFMQLICHAVNNSNQTGQQADIVSNISKLVVNMAQNCDQKWSSARMCKLCGISRAGLFRQFQKYYQTTPWHFLTYQRLSKACTLLKETNKSIEQIATECGFANGNYMGTVFKKKYKITPLQFRDKS